MSKSFDSKSAIIENSESNSYIVHHISDDIFPFRESLTDFIIKKIFSAFGLLTTVVIKGNADTNIYLIKKLLSKNEPGLLLYRVPQNHCYPKIYLFSIRYYRNGSTHYAGGASFSNELSALQKTYGEYLERTSLNINNHKESLLSKSFKTYPFKLRQSSLRIDQIATPLETQQVHTSFPKNNTALIDIPAIKTHNTSINRTELLPCSLFYFVKTNANTPFLNQPTTNGAGGGTSVYSARLSAICELIERDHFLLYWLSGMAPPKIDIDTLPESLKKRLLHDIKHYKIEICILDTTYDIGVFSCLVVIIDPILNKIAFGGAANFEPKQAIEKAYAEALTSIHVTERDGEFNKNFLRTYIPYSDNKINVHRRTRMYNSAFGISTIRQLFLHGEFVSFQNVLNKLCFKSSIDDKKNLQTITERFKKLSEIYGPGYNLYFYEYNNEHLRKNNYHVSKAFVPKLIKLWLNEDMATPNSERVEEFLKKNSINQSHKYYLNTLPHPFP